MIKIDNWDICGWEAAIRGMRNPMNSWEKSDSEKILASCEDPWGCTGYIVETDSMKIGPNDLSLMKRLAKAGTDHRKYLRMITVYVDITAPLYWWKEFDTYKVGTVANSCSTMHKIAAKELTLDDFSHEHLFNDDQLQQIIDSLNYWRKCYLQTKDNEEWWQRIQLLPSSYNQKRTVMLNYEVLANIYKSRKNHKLDEWHTFCDWIKNGLAYSELITGEEE